MSRALKALLDYGQADEDGVMCIVSRQAVHEVANEIEELRATLEMWQEWAKQIKPIYLVTEEALGGK